MTQRRALFRAFAAGLAALGAGQVAPRRALAAPGAAPWIRGLRLNVADLDRSVDFYHRIVGLKLVGRHEDDRLLQAVLNTTGERWEKEAHLVLAQQKGRTTPISTDAVGWISFHVEDVDATLARVRAGGFAITRGPNRDPKAPRYYVYVTDPDGYSVELLHLSNLSG